MDSALPDPTARTTESASIVLGNDEVVNLADCSTFHTVDLAWSQAEDADYTVISSWAVDEEEPPDPAGRHRGATSRDPTSFRGCAAPMTAGAAYSIVERATRQMSIIQEAVRTGLPVHEVRAEKDKVDAILARAGADGTGNGLVPGAHDAVVPRHRGGTPRVPGVDDTTTSLTRCPTRRCTSPADQVERFVWI